MNCCSAWAVKDNDQKIEGHLVFPFLATTKSYVAKLMLETHFSF
jgi:hypothetical protein